MKLNKNILPKEQLELYPHLKTITDLGFTLFGGTAIALQLGHRMSVDFDFFTSKNIEHLHSDLSKLGNIKVNKIIQQDETSLVFQTPNNVKVSLFGEIDFVELANKFKTDDGVLELADLQALLTTKLKVICDRAEYKDYFDITKILQTKKVSLEDGLSGVVRYFGDKFPLINIVKGLNYFEDGDLHRLTQEDKKFLQDVTNKIDYSKIHQTQTKENTNSISNTIQKSTPIKQIKPKKSGRGR